jgi:hypothetical protein
MAELNYDPHSGDAMVIKRIGVLSAAKLYAAISFAMGLIFGVFFALASVIGMSMGAQDESAFFGMMFGVGAVVFLPIFYGLMGFVFGAIGAALYNLFAGMVGGLEVETQ